ncbi:ricin-type beta-trefoil lectin domain protein [Cellulosimicrobium terreum]|nr:ricin-type beta-trefoil lectin domain protein [Cellulosimicrobium terreum]
MHRRKMHHVLTALASSVALAAAGIGGASAATSGPTTDDPPGLATTATLPDGQVEALERDLGLDAQEIDARLALDASTSTVESVLEPVLGDAYAGTWVDTESATATVAVTDPALVDEVEATGAQAVVVDHDLGTLDGLQDDLDDTVAPESVRAWYVDVTTNEVVVESTDPKAAAAFVQDAGVDPDLVRTEQLDAPYELARDVRGGDEYHKPLGNGYVTLCSIGFAVQGGFVTAGHCGSAGNPVSAPDGAALGTYQASGWPGKDYAWVRTTSGWTSTPRVNDYAGGTVAVTGSAEQAIGASVCRSGRTTGWRCGVIEQKNVTVNYESVATTGLTIGTACAEGGDSGGSVISGTQAQGVTSGRIGDCSSGGKFIFQPLQPILSAYGLSLTTTGGSATSSLVGLAGKCIDVPSSDFSDGKRLQLWTCNGSNAQRWTFEPDGTVRAGGKCMDVAWANTADGTAVQLASCSGNAAQQFVLSGAGDLVSVLANKCVDVPNSNSANGTQLQIWTCNGTAAQKWHRA